MATIRFYKSEYPEFGETIMISIRAIMPNISEVSLLEYNNMVATIPTLEIEQKQMKVGNVYPARVTSKDNSATIKVSIKQVSELEVNKCNERYAKGKIIYKLASRAAVRLPVKYLYERVVWYFETKFKKKNAAYDIFQRAPCEPEVLDECGLQFLTKGFLLYFIKNEMSELKFYYSTDIKCFMKTELEEGTMEAALKLILNKNDSSRPIDMKSLGSSKYRISIKAFDAEAGKRILNVVTQRIRQKVKDLNGHFEVIAEPGITREEAAVLNSALAGVNF